MNKNKVSTKCQVCNGTGVVPDEGVTLFNGELHILFDTCDACNGRGKETHWIHEQEERAVPAKSHKNAA